MSDEPRFFADLSRVRSVLRDSASPETKLKRLQPVLEDDEVASAFFRELDDPTWISALESAGWFRAPPEPRRSEGQIRASTWPASGYLVRMAPRAPTEVARILSRIATDNWVVAQDLIEATRAMPPADAATMAPCLGRHVARLGLSYLLDRVAEIIARLAENEHRSAALELADRVFDPRDWRESPKRGSSFEYGLERALRGKIVPALLPATNDFLTLLVQWLVHSVEGDETSDRDERSWMWRPAIERHAQNHDYEFAAKLLNIVRDAFERAITETLISLDGALAILAATPTQVTRRLRLHLIWTFADKNPDLARATVLEEEAFNDSGLKHEYSRLVETRFGALSQDDKEHWLRLVDEAAQRDAEPTPGSSTTPERAQGWADIQKYNRLWWVREHLTGDRKTFVERLNSERGEELTTFHSWSGGEVVGEVSPLSVDDLTPLDFPEVLARVRAWAPGENADRFRGPSYDGLAETFARRVAADPHDASRHAMSVHALKPALIRAFLGAMVSAIKEKKLIALGPVLELCAAVVSRRPEPEDVQASEGQREPDESYWSWTQSTICDLLQEVCKAPGLEKPETRGFSLEHREAIWRVLQPLLHAPSQPNLVEEETAFDPRSVDWLSRSINSPRGRAVEALLEFAGWIAANADPPPDPRKPVLGGFGSMPEVRDEFERQLTDTAAGFNGRAPFGLRLHLLNWIDRAWLEAHIGSIFDLTRFETDPKTAFGWAAWYSYLFGNGPHLTIYALLKEAYSYAVDQAAVVDPQEESREGTWDRLGEHLVILYGRGDLGATLEAAWETDNGVLRRLITCAHVRIRTTAVEFIGRSLYGSKEEIGADIVERFQRLWEKYWMEVGEADAKASLKTQVFGYWFAAESFPAAWALEKMAEVTAVSPPTGQESLFMERLAVIADKDPARAAQIILAMSNADGDYWRIDSWKDEARQALRIALAAGGDAKMVAVQAIDRLGRLGFLEFGQLL